MLLHYLISKIFFKSVNISQGYKQERGCLVHFLPLSQLWSWVFGALYWRNVYMHTHYMNQCFVQITRPRYFSRIDISLQSVILHVNLISQGRVLDTIAGPGASDRPTVSSQPRSYTLWCIGYWLWAFIWFQISSRNINGASTVNQNFRKYM